MLFAHSYVKFAGSKIQLNMNAASSNGYAKAQNKRTEERCKPPRRSDRKERTASQESAPTKKEELTSNNSAGGYVYSRVFSFCRVQCEASLCVCEAESSDDQSIIIHSNNWSNGNHKYADRATYIQHECIPFLIKRIL